MFASYIAKKSGVPSLVPRKKKDLVSKEGLGLSQLLSIKLNHKFFF